MSKCGNSVFFADISRKRTEPERTFTDITLNNLENIRRDIIFAGLLSELPSLYRLYIPRYMYNLVLYRAENIWRD